MKNALKILVGLTLVAMIFSCSTFTEQSASESAEMTAFDKIVLDNVSMSDVKNLGNVEATRTLVYTYFENEDFTIEMDDYKYVYTAETDSFEQTGTRYSGILNSAPVISAAGVSSVMAIGGGDFFSGLFAGMGMGDGEGASAASSISVRDVALEAVTYDLMLAAAEKGGVALLLPEYTWEKEQVLEGTKLNLFGLIKSTTYEKKTVTYTVTARAAAVNF